MAQVRDYTKYLDIISGRRRDPIAVVARVGLSFLTPIYRFGVWIRNRRFDTGRSNIFEVSVPVISVGNLTTGGTGKTPFVIWLSRFIRRQTIQANGGVALHPRVAIVSRGYGAGAHGRNDEAMEMEQRLPDVPHLQGADRYQMASTAIAELDSQLIVLDDGFQHRRLRRDLDIVLVDATTPFGFNRLLPRGLLREPIANLNRADVVVLTRSDLVSDEERQGIKERVLARQPDALWAETVTRPAGWLQANGNSAELAELTHQPLYGCCAIGNPDGFRRTLERYEMDILDLQVFPDHHEYTRSDLEDVATRARQMDAAAIVCTHKDLVKINANRLGGLPLWSLQIDVEFLAGQSELERLIAQHVTGACNQ